LIQPEEGTPEYQNVKHDLEEMIRLVEAVRLVDTKGVTVRGRKVEEDSDREYNVPTLDNDGQALLQLASQTQHGFYVVESERRR
jgi:Asp-tRNA(Asn)/Glu-tRNA(Gln) amidotransferase C subunit